MDGLFKKAFDAIRMGKEKEGIGHITEFIASRPRRSQRLVPARVGAPAPGPLRARARRRSSRRWRSAPPTRTS